MTVLCNCLILFLYSFSFSTALALSSWALAMCSLSFSPIRSKCLITLLIVGTPYVVSLSCTLGVWLSRNGDSPIASFLWTPGFSELLATILVAVGDDFFLGVASANAESDP